LLVPSSSGFWRNLHNEVVIGVSSKSREVSASDVKVAELPEAGWYSRSPWKAVSRDFVLEVDITDRWPDVVTVQSFFRGDVLEPDLGSSQDMLDWQVIPGV
jgi:hypothetical protein